MQRTFIVAKVAHILGTTATVLRGGFAQSLLVGTAFLALHSCSLNPHEINLKGKEVEVKLLRLDEDLFELTPDKVEAAIPQLEKQYGTFLTDYTNGVLRIGSPADPAFAFSLGQFIADASMRELYDKSRKEYTDVSDIHTELNNAFSYFHHHFPDSTVPNVVLNISGLNFAIVATKTTLAIGVDMFLGADYPVYPMVGLPQYMFRNMKRDQVVPQAMTGWLQSMYEQSAPNSNLLEQMVFHGKLLYALDAILVSYPDSAKIGYTLEEMEWCSTNEQAVWAHLSQQQMLYSTDQLLINKWINQAPFISGIPKQSPGRLGHVVGWNIVRKYMQLHPETTLQQLMSIQSAQEILSRSKYKPSK